MKFCHECGGYLDDHNKGRFYCGVCNITWNLIEGIGSDLWTRKTPQGIQKITVLHGHVRDKSYLPPKGGTSLASTTTGVV